MTKKIKKIYNIEKYFTVDWTVGSTCNFSCSYCPEELHDGKTTWLDTKNLRKFLDKIYKFTELPLHFIIRSVPFNLRLKGIENTITSLHVNPNDKNLVRGLT